MHTNCTLCGSDKLRFALSFIDSKRQFVKIDICDQCQVLIPQYPTVNANNAQEKQASFHEDWWQNSQADELSRTLAEICSVIKNNRHYLGEPVEDNYILELGCGRGSMLRALIDEGYSAIGCEPAAGLVRLARKHYQLGPEVLFKMSADTFLRDKVPKLSVRPRVIFLWHVLEHLVEPMQLIRDAHEALAEQGCLILQVPLLCKEYVYPEHYFFVSHETFQVIANETGFHLEEVVYDIDNLFVTVYLRKQISLVLPSLSPPSFLCNEAGTLPSVLTQAILLRDQSIMEKRICLNERIEAMAAMEGMIQDRDKQIETLTNMITEREETVQAQVKLIDERIEAMATMEGMIQDRDKCIDTLESSLECKESEIRRVYSNKIIKVMMKIKLIR